MSQPFFPTSWLTENFCKIRLFVHFSKQIFVLLCFMNGFLRLIDGVEC
ncbi:hypothetical protein HMPREF9442_02274 [Paraprevotella xylaniphila YIT 11841]|uniref:Uncharacterized protein n=1 Tax=Paraprevotella xylaniphila YIT 11841 TaxID=762982 RepID=F3QVV1_9BACT|nr:hypothetical protein HMPREF9442_02274 [Paraprevotella xylaniphila YIT 11841]